LLEKQPTDGQVLKSSVLCDNLMLLCCLLGTSNIQRLNPDATLVKGQHLGTLYVYEGFGLETAVLISKSLFLVLILGLEVYHLGNGLAFLVLVSHSRSWQSVADLDSAHPILVFNLKCRHKLIHITITHYSELME